LRALSLCACCRHYPGAATGRRLRSSHPALSAFPEIAVGSACTSSFSRLARRSLASRPAHSRRHLYVTSHFVTSMTAPVASGWSGWPDGACTHWNAPPSHGAHVKQTFPIVAGDVAVDWAFAIAKQCEDRSGSPLRDHHARDAARRDQVRTGLMAPPNPRERRPNLAPKRSEALGEGVDDCLGRL
jgi:hypothetical protein